MLLNGGREPTVARPCRPRVPLSFQLLCTAILLIGQESKKGGKSLIKQIISCWDENSSISEPPPRMLEDLLNSHVLVAHFPPPSFDCLQAVDGLRVTVILTFQDVHAFGGFLLYFYSPNSHEGLLLLVSLTHYFMSLLLFSFC